MTDPRGADEIMVHVAYIREAVDGINERLDIQNGRIRATETQIAVLNDRQSDGRKAGAFAGTVAGVLGGLVSGFLRGGSWR